MNEYAVGSPGLVATIMAMMGAYMVFVTIISIVCIVSQWKIFKKAGESGVAAIVPFWNTAVLCKITWGQWYYMFLLFIPIVNTVILVITMLKLAKVFGKSTGFGIGMIFFSFIFMPILAFSSAQYIGIGENTVKRDVIYDADENEDGVSDVAVSSLAGSSDIAFANTEHASYSNPLTDQEAIPFDDVISETPRSSSNTQTGGRHWSL